MICLASHFMGDLGVTLGWVFTLVSTIYRLKKLTINTDTWLVLQSRFLHVVVVCRWWERRTELGKLFANSRSFARTLRLHVYLSPEDLEDHDKKKLNKIRVISYVHILAVAVTHHLKWERGLERVRRLEAIDRYVVYVKLPRLHGGCRPLTYSTIIQPPITHFISHFTSESGIVIC
jgi:predicted membrane chloride channel (bestrophin family)